MIRLHVISTIQKGVRRRDVLSQSQPNMQDNSYQFTFLSREEELPVSLYYTL